MIGMLRGPTLSTMTLASVLATAGCAASIQTRVTEPVPLESSSSVAVLAVMPGTVAPGSEWLRTHAMQRLVEAVSERYPGVVLVGPDEAVQRLTNQSLAREYASILSDYDMAGVVDPGRIEALVHALGVTHLLQLRVGFDSEGLQRATTLLSDDPLFYDTKHQSLLAIARLWGPSGTGPSWEAVVTSQSQAGPLSRDRDPIDLVDSLILAVANRLPIARSLTATANQPQP